MTENKIGSTIELLPGLKPATVETKVSEAAVDRELDDLFSNLNAGQNTNAASIAAGLICLSIGSGYSRDV